MAPEGQAQGAQSQKPEMRTVPIPFTDLPWGSLQVPYPMTGDAWTELNEYLTLMERRLKGPLAKSVVQSGSVDA